ncbi:hypothetical protein A3B48_03040 [Candidatus Gottesmanbacteria bacterium RIFCSPLOWO2_01_FULL_40_10]|nr:MAG: hypothetical protein A3B48_03040 [Candidatus Gottesmanbacteria bacterium RIFCSPLOWO2_01_FULL_40_10]
MKNRQKKNIPFSQGQSIIELLIAIAISSILLPGLIQGLTSSREGKAQQKQRNEAYQLLIEAEEAVKQVRERNWNEISVNGTFHPLISGTYYILQPGSESLSGFTRQISIEDAYRDANGVLSGTGEADPSTRKITTTVSWSQPNPSDVESIIYLTRYINNSAYTETTIDDFDRGTQNGVAVIDDFGGEVVLGTGGTGSWWCNPNLSISAVDLPRQGVANAVSAIEGQVVAGTGENASGVSFANTLISNPPAPTPPGGTIEGTFDGYKTNGVFGEDDFAYLATDTNAKEIVIIDLTGVDINGKFTEAGYFNAPGNADAQSVFVSGNIGFALIFNILYTFDLSEKAGARPLLSQITLAGTGNRIFVRGNYAYIAVESLSKQLQIIEVSPDGTVLTETGFAQLDASYGRDVFVNQAGNRIYMATAVSSTQREMFTIDTTIKNGQRPVVATYETNGMNPKGITVVTGNKAIIVGTGGEEYQVINIIRERIDPPMPKCGGLNIDTGINGLSSVLEADGDVYSYIITGDANAELKIIAGGPGGQYTTTGIYESAPFDAGTAAAFNRLEFTTDIPINTTLNLQVAVTEAVNDNCNDALYTYVGPDGLLTGFFTQAGSIPINGVGTYKNPGRCFRYKANFNSDDIFYSPVLYDVTVNYSP